MKKVFKKISANTLSLFGVGLLPKAPGTAASLVTAIIVYLALPYTTPFLLSIIVITLTVLSVNLIRLYVPSPHDRKWIVIDELIGTITTYSIIGIFEKLNLTNLVAGLILFRLFDIYKPLIIKRVDQSNTPFSVIFDDILAGFFSAIIWICIIQIFPHL